MVQVKMIKQRSQLIEKDINEQLQKIGSVPYTKINLIDIKMDYHEKDDTYTAMIIYNAIKVQPPKPEKPANTSLPPRI